MPIPRPCRSSGPNTNQQTRCRPLGVPMGTRAALRRPSTAARSEVDRMTRKLALGALLVAAVAAAGACQSQEQKKDETKAAGAGGAASMSEDEKVVYVIGLRIGGQATILHLSPGEVEALKRGVADAATGKKPEVDPDAYGPKVQ